MIFKSTHSIELKKVDLYSLIFSQARENKKRALIDANSGEDLTFQDLDFQIRSLAAGLSGLGFGPGNVLAIFAPNCLDFAIPMFAAIYLGGTVFPFHSTGVSKEFALQLETSHVSILFTTPHLLPITESAASAASIDPSRIFLLGKHPAGGKLTIKELMKSPNVPPFAFKEEDLERTVFLLSSSGTSGKPKCIELSHRNASALVEIQEYALLGEKENVVWSLITPIAHGYGLFLGLLCSLKMQITAVMFENYSLFQIFQSVEKYRITTLLLVPAIILQFFQNLELAASYDISSLKQIFSGGSSLAPSLHRKFEEKTGIPIIQGYGMTESASALMNLPNRRIGSIGVLLSNAEAKVVDLTTGKALSYNQEGEICFRGPAVIKGYLNNPKATQELTDEEGFVHTGDVGLVDEEGFFYLKERMKELIKFRGAQVSPTEIEDILLDHPSVADASVIPVMSKQFKGEVPKALVVLKPGSKADSEDIIKFVAQRVSSEKQLRGGVDFIDQIPRNSLGKILRRVLVEQEKKKESEKIESLEKLFSMSKWIKQMYIHTDFLEGTMVILISPNKDTLRNAAQEKKIPENQALGNVDIKNEVLNDLLQIASDHGIASADIPEAVYLVSEEFTKENSLLDSSGKLNQEELEKHFFSEIQQCCDEVSVMKKKITELLNKVLKSKVHLENLDLDTNLEALGSDSLGATQFAYLIKETFHKEIPIQKFLGASSVADLSRFILSNLDVAGSNLEIFEKDGREEFEPDEQTKELIQKFKGNAKKIVKKSFITGCTGFLGVFMLAELLEKSQGLIYCLVRSSSQEEGMKKILGKLSEIGQSVPLEKKNRIQVLLGDLSLPYLGLSQHEFLELSKELDEIYHVGAKVNWMNSYPSLRAVNFLGTKVIVDLGTLNKIKPICYISTISVAGQKEDEFMDQKDLEDVANGYSLTKMNGEKFVRSAIKKGVPITIFRPGFIAGHSISGFSNKEDFVDRYLMGICQMGYLIQDNAEIDLTPVDFVTSTIFYIFKQGNSSGMCFHVINEKRISYSDLAKYVLSFGLPLKGLPYFDWHQKFQLILQDPKGSTNSLFPLASYFPPKSPLSVTKFGIENTSKFLENSGIKCPEPSEKLVHQYLHHLRSNHWLTQSQNPSN